MTKRALTMFILAVSLLAAACGGSAASAGTSVEPFSPDTSIEAPDQASPEASPDQMSPEASPS